MNIIAEHWNRVSRRDVVDEIKERDYIRASELGKPMIDRWLSMKGHPVSNPFSDRLLRIFGAGHVIEFITLRVLAMAGILNKKQEPISMPEGPDNLRISGRLDATIGGVADWDAARTSILSNLREYRLDLDEELLEGKAVQIIEGLKQSHPNGWTEEMVVEVKSINSNSFWGGRSKGKFTGYDNNKLQLYAYLLMTGLRQGILLYVSKDDFSIEEIPVRSDDRNMADIFWDDVRTITRYYRDDVRPPLEPLMVYNEGKGVFEENSGVSRSPYLTLAYGFENEQAFYHSVHQTVLDVNRALRHLRDDGNLKPEDLAVIAEHNLTDYI